MSEFEFDPERLRKSFQHCVDVIIDETKLSGSEDVTPQQLAVAMEQAFDVIERLEVDLHRADLATDVADRIGKEDITKIGEYAVSILEGVVAFAVDAQLDTSVRELQTLIIPLALWVARNGGKLTRLELIVNAFAEYANRTSDTAELSVLCDVMGEVLEAVSAEIRSDLEELNPQRPWRLLNINQAIVATRSHDPEVMERAFEILICNMPDEARTFFCEGMEQMDIVGYPQQVRVVMEKYHKLWESGDTVH